MSFLHALKHLGPRLVYFLPCRFSPSVEGENLTGECTHGINLGVKKRTCLPRPGLRSVGDGRPMLRAMLATALLVVAFIGPTHSQDVQGTGVSGGLKINQPRFNQARLGAMRQTTEPGGPLMETSAKKKAKKDKCAKLPHLTSQDTPNQKTPSPRRLAGQARNRRRLHLRVPFRPRLYLRVPFRRRPQWPVPRGAQLPTRKRGVSTRRASLAPHDAPTCRAPTSHRAKRVCRPPAPQWQNGSRR